MKLIVRILFLILVIETSWSQSDTLLTIPSIEIWENSFSNLQEAHRIIKLDSLLIANSSPSLSNLLQQNSAIYLKARGANSLSTVSVRGTGPNHTSLQWNGVPINLLSLGMNDFSIIPIDAFEEVFLQLGSSGAINGSSAIGGVISIGVAQKLSTINAISFLTRFGSFGNYSQKLSYKFSRNNFSSSTKVFNTNAQNRFPYINSEKSGSPTEKQEYAAQNLIGFTNDLTYALPKGYSIYSNVWIQKSKREIQQTMSVQSDSSYQHDGSQKFSFKVVRDKSISSSFFQIASVNDQILYVKPKLLESLSKLSLLNFQTETSQQLTTTNKLHIGIRSQFNNAQIANYNGKKTELRSDVYFGLKSSFLKDQITVNQNYRLVYLSDQFKQFCPSLDVKLNLAPSTKIKTHVSKGYRLPTFNERYWSPGGNLNLLPEESINYELGIDKSFMSKQFTSTLEMNYYRLAIKNWILWRPTNFGYWAPENLESVISEGVEISSNNFFTNLNIKYSFTGTYLRNYLQKDSLKTQNSYVPKVKLSNTVSYVQKQNTVLLTHSFVANRLNLAQQILPYYNLIDIMYSRRKDFKKSSLEMSLSVRNILNSTYQTYENMAMPGRYLELTINFNQLLK